MTLPKELTISPRVDRFHFGLQAGRSRCDFALVVSIVPVGLPVRFEAAALIEVDQHATEFMGSKDTIERFAAQPVRIELCEFHSRLGIGRHQSKADQHLHDALSPLEKPIAAAAGRSRAPALFAERFFVFWVSAVVEYPNATVEEARGSRAGAAVVDRENRPADRLRAKIEGKTEPLVACR
jgi:hypothetical protein